MPEESLSAPTSHQCRWLRERPYLPFQALDKHRGHTRGVAISMCDRVMLLAFEKNDILESSINKRIRTFAILDLLGLWHELTPVLVH
jgi:hypothetical protein